MKVLNLIDISPFIHAGHFKSVELPGPVTVNTEGKYVHQSIPAGGVSFLLNSLQPHLVHDTVFCADRNASIKKAQMTNYKERSYNSVVAKQRKLAELILEDCDLTVLAMDGYEADDIIFSIWKHHSKDYDKVRIFTGDSDLYFMVDDKTEILPTNSKGKHVTKENYAFTCKSKHVIPYNSIMMHKILYGDPSDNVARAIPIKVAHSIYQAVIREPLITRCHDIRIIRSLLGRFSPPEYRDALLERADFLMPIDCGELINHGVSQPNENLDLWGRALQCYAYGNSFTHPRISSKCHQIVNERLLG